MSQVKQTSQVRAKRWSKEMKISDSSSQWQMACLWTNQLSKHRLMSLITGSTREDPSLRRSSFSSSSEHSKPKRSIGSRWKTQKWWMIWDIPRPCSVVLVGGTSNMSLVIHHWSDQASTRPSSMSCSEFPDSTAREIPSKTSEIWLSCQQQRANIETIEVAMNQML